MSVYFKSELADYSIIVSDRKLALSKVVQNHCYEIHYCHLHIRAYYI